MPDSDSSQTWNFERAADGIVALRGEGLVGSSSKQCASLLQGCVGGSLKNLYCETVALRGEQEGKAGVAGTLAQTCRQTLSQGLEDAAESLHQDFGFCHPTPPHPLTFLTRARL